jgi:methylated-DNA-[protein]-cysteine S-methyltransferase
VLSEPHVDFDGGEFVLLEQRPRAQSRAHVLTPPRGAFVLFPTHHRPNAGRSGYHRVGLRHGVSTITRGERTAHRWDVHETPIGPLTLHAGPRGLVAIAFPGRGRPVDETARDPAALAGAGAQLDEYFAGERTAFDLALDLRGTPFQRRVWEALLEIPYGTTVTYTELAEAVGRPDIVRAVAAAVGRTPVPIVVPCHRVLGSGGALTGYGGGLHRKQALLDLERRGVLGLAPEPAWAFRQLVLL